MNESDSARYSKQKNWIKRSMLFSRPKMSFDAWVWEMMNIANCSGVRWTKRLNHELGLVNTVV